MAFANSAAASAARRTDSAQVSFAGDAAVAVAPGRACISRVDCIAARVKLLHNVGPLRYAVGHKCMAP